MRVAIRVDSSAAIGYGHLSRTLNIALELRSRGFLVYFICRDFESSGVHWITAANFEVVKLPQSRPPRVVANPKPKHLSWLGVSLDEEIAVVQSALKERGIVDWLLIDSYALDRRFESAMRTYTRKIAVLDDLADRAHECDLLIDGAFLREAGDYSSLVSKRCKLLCGSQYQPLRSDYGRFRALAMPRRFPPKTVLVSMGGIDSIGLIAVALNALAKSRFANAALVAVLSSRAPRIAEYQALGGKLGLKIDWRFDTDDMPLLILRSDLGVGALGVSAYERACLGLACVTAAAADNQRENLARLGAAGAVIAEETIGLALERLDEARFRRCERAAFEICDGLGAARICEAMQSAALR
ncbi:MAG: UDP-2,4-diacetamido-2,4,6-trideoxy-beta-L-altropyranose hydrolase [Helicobacteraceae bacterium]|nr:UDP-2,4-diacetamido-2,4,6-trideoxy-beta-L-altropyranose hydrolase [Helicobacteraceae bacterium]